jgi:2-C-methyl-D-erythritol 4-phosphate cytidylyltransferase
VTCGAVIPAAGGSRRMATIDKTLALLGGRRVIDWVLDAFDQVEEISQIILVAGEQNEADLRRIVSERDADRMMRMCRGGDRRQDSVAAGVSCLSASVDLVVIHDAVRPLVTPDLIRRGIVKARECGSAVAAIPVVDTVKQVDSTGRVMATPRREVLYAAQTPQAFRRDWLMTAYRSAQSHTSVTDEASLLEIAGLPVFIYPGSPENLKLTTPTDLLIAETLLARHMDRHPQ